MLERAHGARIDVDVRIQLHQADREAARFENGAQGSRGNAFAQRRNNTAGYTDKTRHRKAPSQTRRKGDLDRDALPSKVGEGGRINESRRERSLTQYVAR